MSEAFTVVAAIAWSVLWVNFAVIPFYFKREKLHQDFVGTGQLDAALSFIDSEKITPALVAIFETAISAQEDKRRRVDLKALLTQVDVLSDLEELDTASIAKRQLIETLDRLQARSSRIWKIGLAHAFSVVATPFLADDALGKWGIPAVVLCGSFAIFALVILVSELIIFESRLGAFTDQLKSARASVSA